MKVTRLLVLALVASLVSGCAFRHVDRKTQFLIRGAVLDRATNRPLDNVSIAFIDTGFDSVRSKSQISGKIGESDRTGRIDLSFDYWWGTDEGLFGKKAKRTFGLEFSRNQYEPKRLHFSASELKEEDDKLQVLLDTIYLERRLE